MKFGVSFLYKRCPEEVLVFAAGKEGIWLTISILNTRQHIINYNKHTLSLLLKFEDIESKLLQFEEISMIKAIYFTEDRRLHRDHTQCIQKPLVLELWAMIDPLTVNSLILSDGLGFFPVWVYEGVASGKAHEVEVWSDSLGSVPLNLLQLRLQRQQLMNRNISILEDRRQVTFEFRIVEVFCVV